MDICDFIKDDRKSNIVFTDEQTNEPLKRNPWIQMFLL